MSRYLTPSAEKRLPAAIRKLNEKEREVFVLLRMRRGEDRIARELGVSLPEAGELVRAVQDALIRGGAIDLVSDPVFFPIDQPQWDSHGKHAPAFEPVEKDMEAADRLALDRFYRALKESIDKMPKEGRRLLKLWFNDEMRAKDILNFYKNMGVTISSNKSIRETAEQDVFHAIEKNIRNLLDIVRSNMSEDEMKLTPPALRAILEETGV